MIAGENTYLPDGTRKITLGLNWETVYPKTDVVPGVLVLDDNDKLISQEDMVFFGNLSNPSDSVEYIIGDDKEQIDISLNKIPDIVQRLYIFAYVDPDLLTPQTFDDVKFIKLRVLDRSGQEFLDYTVDMPQKNFSALSLFEIYRYKGKWKVRALFDPYRNLQHVETNFGVNL